MKKKQFTFFEEKYIFSISRLFWRSIVLLFIIGAIISLGLTLWGIIPTSKEKVVQAKYPPVKQVSLNEVLGFLEEKKTNEVKKLGDSQEKKVTPDQQQDTTGLFEYTNALMKLKELMPPNKFQWKESGHWYYPYGKYYYDRYKERRYRKWRIDYPGIEKKLKSTIKDIGVYDYMQKGRILKNINATINLFQLDDRMKIFNSLINIIYGSFDLSMERINIMQNMTKTFSAEDIATYVYLSKILKNNPNDGIPLFNGVNPIINAFDSSERLQAFKIIYNAFYENYQGNITELVDITKDYLPYLEKLNPEQQTKGLIAYYTVLFDKNMDRKSKINHINYHYQAELAEAEVKYEAKKATKKDFRNKAVIGIAGGLAGIAIIALLLVLFSIQKYIKKINEYLTLNTNEKHNSHEKINYSQIT